MLLRTSTRLKKSLSNQTKYTFEGHFGAPFFLINSYTPRQEDILL